MRIAYSIGTTSFGSFPCVSLKLNGFSTAPTNDLIKNKTRNATSGMRMIYRTIRRPTAPWLVSSLVLPKLFEPRIAKRFEAGAEEDRAVAQAIKLGCRLAPPSHLRLVKPNRIQRKIYPTKSAHTSMSPMPDVLEKPDASKERPITKTPKNERKK